MKKSFEQHREWENQARQSLVYKVAEVQTDFAYKLEHLLKRRKQSRTQLADAIQTSKAYITKILGGDANFTIETMVKVLDALDADLLVNAKPREINLARTWSNTGTKRNGKKNAEILQGVLMSERNRGTQHAAAG